MSADSKEDNVDTDALRAELKSWENAFKQEHGRKPGRADIKIDATIGLCIAIEEESLSADVFLKRQNTSSTIESRDENRQHQIEHLRRVHDRGP